MASDGWSVMRSRCGAGQQSARSYSNTNGSPSANSPLTMITKTKPVERKGVFLGLWRSLPQLPQRDPVPALIL